MPAGIAVTGKLAILVSCIPEQVEVIPARYLQIRCWNVRDERGGRSE
ncbi:TPA: hypothetical protein L1212_004442 [Escherichia coli]|nr:hypothetical protein [Escherichia coli]